MKVTAFLIKYGEIAIKGKNRYMFEDALMKQIRHAMAPVGDFKVRKESGRLLQNDGGEDRLFVIA